MKFTQRYAWSDSTVTLSWIKSSPHRWQTFVANRVSHIQEKISPENWYHVPSSENPADCASRGLLPLDLLNDYSHWFTGPLFLSLSHEQWPTQSSVYQEVIPEEKRVTFASFIALDNLDTLVNKFSSLAKIKRIVAYILRFIFNLRNPENKRKYNFTHSELQAALLLLVKRVQHNNFAEDIARIKQNLPISKLLKKLNPFIDTEGLLRVGGRLQNSALSYDQKHPALLPRCSRLTELIIEDTHKTYLHPGPQTVQFLLSRNFWILSPKRAIRHVLSKCHKCWRLKPNSYQPPMGNLPLPRVSQVKPFSVVGVDYGGPFTITLGKVRGAKTHKAYISLFICLSTKALHLELASDLSTEAFLAAFRRFLARRGRCSRVYSDCGTNFIGARKYLKQITKDIAQLETIDWIFNPPSAPHFGGIWEAGIKSVKTHLYRVIGDQVLTYEELNTVLVQIESVLNSRPLSPQSTDVNDLSPLTPGHFLTLEPLTCLPDPEVGNIKLNQLTRWQLIQRLHQDFWSRWHNEYLHTLQQRAKWTNPATPIEPGTMVVIKGENTPPLKWSLGRIVCTHPGKDGVSRVATVKTIQGTYKRPLIKLCPLPSV